MEIRTHIRDLPVTPTGRQFLDSDLYTLMNVAIGLKHEIDLDALKSHLSNSIILKIPRFSSLLVKHDDNNDRYYFRPTQVNIDNHIIVCDQNRGSNNPREDAVDDGGKDDNITVEETEEDVVNDYLADLAALSDPLTTDKPLWELHVLMDVKCLVLRVHHAVCDGSTLMSVIKEIGSIGDNSDGGGGGKVMVNGDDKISGKDCGDGKPIRKMNSVKSGRKRTSCWYSLVYCTQLLARFVNVKDKKTAVNDGGKYVKHRPQGMATARFSLDDFNLVRKAIPHATINDVLTGVLWGGLVKYLDARSETAVKEGRQITGIAMVNMRKQKGLQDISKSLNTGDKSRKTWLGNNTSIMLVPLHYTRKLVDPLDYVRKAKSIMDKKKQSCEPRFLVKVQKTLLCICGLKVVNYLTTRGGCNSTFGISNVVGPSKEIAIGGNPVTYVKLTVCSSPVRLMMHLVSYMKNLDLQILVPTDIISDPKFLAECFTETLKSMKNAVEETVVKQGSVKLETSCC